MFGQIEYISLLYPHIGVIAFFGGSGQLGIIRQIIPSDYTKLFFLTCQATVGVFCVLRLFKLLVD